LSSAFFWAYTLLQTPTGWIIDRFGMKWPYAAALFVWSAASAVSALVDSLIGIPMSGTKYGPAIGAPVATYLVLGYGWRWMFVLNGALDLLWLAPWLFFIKNDAETVEVRAKVILEGQASWGAIFSAPVIWGTCLGTFCYMYFVNFVFDFNTGKELQSLPIAAGVDDVSFDPASKRIYVACGDGAGSIYVYHESGPDGYELLGEIASAPGAATARLVPELKQYIALAPHKKTHRRRSWSIRFNRRAQLQTEEGLAKCQVPTNSER
jgi:MFS family permease